MSKSSIRPLKNQFLAKGVVNQKINVFKELALRRATYEPRGKKNDQNQEKKTPLHPRKKNYLQK